MDRENQNDGSVEDVENSTSKESSFFTQKDASQVVGRLISTNYAVMMAGLNGKLLLTAGVWERSGLIDIFRRCHRCAHSIPSACI